MTTIGNLLAETRTLLDAGQHRGAQELLVRILQLDPGCSDAWHLYGVLEYQAGRHEQAVEKIAWAIRLNDQDANYHFNLSLAQSALGDWKEAVGSLDRVLALEPNSARAQSNQLFILNYDPLLSADAIWERHRCYGERLARHYPVGNAGARPIDPDRRLRLGFVSPNFYLHPVFHFFEPLLAHINPDDCETFLYSEVEVAEPAAARLRELAHGWRDIGGWSDGRVAEQIQHDGIDILIDLAGHSAGNRMSVFATKPAPIQISYLGYPNTTGLTAIDYRLTDAVADPPGEPQRHSETLIRLAPSFFCFRPPEGSSDPVGPPPFLRNGIVTFGSLHNFAKLNDHVLDTWRRLLRLNPRSQLLIFRDSLVGEAQDRLIKRLVNRGLPIDRCILRHWIPPENSFLSVYDEIDISLDVFPWSGHTTTLESLWTGVPVVTLCGHRHASRMSASTLTALGCPRWIAASPAEYLSIASDLAAHPTELVKWREQLRARLQGSALCDAQAFATQFSQTMRRLWRKWCVSPAPGC